MMTITMTMIEKEEENSIRSEIKVNPIQLVSAFLIRKEEV